MCCCTQVLAEKSVNKRDKMKRLILFLVLVLHSIRFYNDYRSASALTHVSAENTYFASNRYFQFEKGTLFASLFIAWICCAKIQNLFVSFQRKMKSSAMTNGRCCAAAKVIDEDGWKFNWHFWSPSASTCIHLTVIFFWKKFADIKTIPSIVIVAARQPEHTCTRSNR